MKALQSMTGRPRKPSLQDIPGRKSSQGLQTTPGRIQKIGRMKKWEEIGFLRLKSSILLELGNLRTMAKRIRTVATGKVVMVTAPANKPEPLPYTFLFSEDFYKMRHHVRHDGKDTGSICHLKN